MSQLDDMMRTLAPNGIRYCALSEVAILQRGTRVVRGQLATTGEIPVYQNSLTPMGYHTESNFPQDTTFVICAGAAGEIGYSDVDFWAADDCTCVVCSDQLLNRYVYHALLNQEPFILSQVRKASIPRLSRTALEKLVIPVPPIEVQREIVRILDNFTLLTAELTAELTARQKQYEYYRDQLLTFVDNGGGVTRSDIKWCSLIDLCDYVDYRGKTPHKTDEGVFLVTAKNIKKGYIDYNASCEYIASDDYSDVMRRGLPQIGDLLITTEAPCGNVALVDREDIALAQRVIKYRPKNPNQIMTAFMKHYMLSKEFQTKLLAQTTGGTVQGIKGSKLHLMLIPIPSLIEQQKIVSILDRLDSLCNDLSTGLPAEIAARQKQYEYYRDKLLTFKPLEA